MPAIADDAIPADETVADKEPAVADDAIRADKEKKEKQHAEIVAKRHKAALAKKKRDEKREAKAAAAREEETDEEAEPAAEPAQVEPEAGEANETVAMEADESGEAGASSMGYEAVMPHEEARVIVSMLHTYPPRPAHAAYLTRHECWDRSPRRSLSRARRARRRGALRSTLPPPRAPLRLRHQRCSTPSSARRSRSRWDRASRPAIRAR